MQVDGRGDTDIGSVRTTNEDSWLIDANLGLYAVSDGMGGHAGGEVASAMTIASISESMTGQRALIERVGAGAGAIAEVAEATATAIGEACRSVYERACSDPELAGMGCTATVLVAAGSRAAMAHVGDTRLYLVRGGRAHQLSSDHTLAAELVRQGSLSPEHEQSHPYAHVLTRAIGTQALVEVETLTFDLAIGDRLVLCSDGLGDYIPDRQWLVERVVGRPLESLPRGLIDFAIGAGGHDNVTVVVAEVTGEDDTSSPEPLDTEQLLNVVGTSYLFSDLTLAQLSRVLQRGRVVDFAPGAVIHRGGELLGDLLLVVAGEVQVQSPSGSVVVGTGQHLGESVVLRPRVVESSIVAGGAPVTILALDEPAIVDLANRRPWLGATLLRRLAQRLSGSDEGTVSL